MSRLKQAGLSAMNWLAARAERPLGFHRRRFGWAVIVEFSLWGLPLGALVLLAFLDDPIAASVQLWPLVLILVGFTAFIAAGVWLVRSGRKALSKAGHAPESEPD